jgi:hypothetical protein
VPLQAVKKSEEEDACSSALGEFGWWQLRAILLVALVKVPSAWQMASILFTGLSPGEFWCARPSDFLSWDIQEWKEYVHPNTSAVSIKTGILCYTVTLMNAPFRFDNICVIHPHKTNQQKNRPTGKLNNQSNEEPVTS